VQGLDILNLIKTPLIFPVVFHITVWGTKPNKATTWRQDWLRVLLLGLGL